MAVAANTDRPAVGVVVLAAGASRRMEGWDKVFAPLGGRPVIHYSLCRFDEAAAVDAVIVVGSWASFQKLKSFIYGGGYKKIKDVVPGGTRRQDSAAAGLAAVAPFVGDDGWVLVHDAARPLVTPAIIDGVLAALAAGADGVVPAVPIADTIKRVEEDGEIVATLARERLVAVQTPQGFRYAALAAAYERAAREAWDLTDDAAAVELNGGRVVAVTGDVRNIKITYAADLTWAEALLAREGNV